MKVQGGQRNRDAGKHQASAFFSGAVFTNTSLKKKLKLFAGYDSLLGL